MGEYYKWVNVDRMEYICPVDFGWGCKHRETQHKGNSFLCALYELLSTDWAGDHIIWFGDHIASLESSDNDALNTLYEHTLRAGYPGSAGDTIEETYKNISGIFKETEKEIREELEYYLFQLNQHGIGIDNPFKDFFLREGKDFKYTINHTARIYFSRDKTKIKFLDDTECEFVNPLPIFMSYGESCNIGHWLGDEISVSDEAPDDYVLLTEMYIGW